MTTPCETARQLIQGRLDETLAGPESAALQEHLALCSACRREKAWLTWSLAALRSTPDPLLPPAFLSVVLARARQRLTAPVSRRALWGIILATLASSTLLLIAWDGWLMPLFWAGLDATLRMTAGLAHSIWSSGSALLTLLARILSPLLTTIDAILWASLRACAPSYTLATLAVALLSLLPFLKESAEPLPTWRNS
ncbi:MAG: zf-HC2 domain-containing protein [Vicinamibacteria bacterium]|jgi:predicted anti-sigma-YlaC factor YlaD|nr:zf-HC2 domain-containing protein [Vicinamibacteria bacterium]